MRALPVTNNCWPAGRPSTTPFSHAFQPAILWISSNTSRRLDKGQVCCCSTARSAGTSQFR